MLIRRRGHAERLIRVRRIRISLREPRQESRTLPRVLRLKGPIVDRLLNVSDAILVALQRPGLLLFPNLRLRACWSGGFFVTFQDSLSFFAVPH